MVHAMRSDYFGQVRGAIPYGKVVSMTQPQINYAASLYTHVRNAHQSINGTTDREQIRVIELVKSRARTSLTNMGHDPAMIHTLEDCMAAARRKK